MQKLYKAKKRVSLLKKHAERIVMATYPTLYYRLVSILVKEMDL